MLESYGINKKPTTVKNPQSNSRHERMHQTIAEMIRTQVIICDTEKDIPNEIDYLAQSIAWAMRTAVHTVLDYSPGQLVFNKDMIVHAPTVANWQLIRAKEKVNQIKNNDRENKTRTNTTYKKDGKIMIITTKENRRGKTIGYEHEGPYKIIRVNKNGTVRIQRNGFEETINIRRIKPFVEEKEKEI